jgi:UDP-glucose 4-epimerase
VLPQKNILITGGFGYVGGRITQALLNTNQYQVYVTSRANDIPQEFTNTQNLRLVKTNQVFDAKTTFDCSFETIIHLAAFNEIDCAKKPIEAAEFNIINSIKLLSKAIKCGTKQFIYFSTAHIYSGNLQGTITEQTLPRPQHPYAITHKAFEDYVLAANDKNEIEGIVLRMSNSFGTPITKNVNRWTLLINDLCKQAVRFSEIKLNSNGTQQRDFITLTNVVNATLFFVEKNLPKNDGLFNLGGNNSKSILEIAEIIKKRASICLQKELTIEILDNNNVTQANKELIFCSDKLKNIGFSWVNNFNEEIDNLLIFCNTHFSNNE